jgi:hypothetical protein
MIFPASGRLAFVLAPTGLTAVAAPAERTKLFSYLLRISAGATSLVTAARISRHRTSIDWPPKVSGSLSLKYVSHQQKSALHEWLFNVVADSAKQNALLAQPPEAVARLKKQFAAWEIEVRPTR